MSVISATALSVVQKVGATEWAMEGARERRTEARFWVVGAIMGREESAESNEVDMSGNCKSGIGEDLLFVFLFPCPLA